MKAWITFFLLAWIPTLLLSSNSLSHELYGVWYDDYSNTKLEIKHSRKGIKVKSHAGWFHKWRTYNYMGRGLYDDCDGRVIVVLGQNRIEWRKGYRRSPILLKRYHDYDRYNYRDGYDYQGDYGNRGYDYRNDRSNNRNYQQSGYGRDAYSGDWYCSDHKLNLRIELSGSGLRARSGNKWTYYEPYDDHYRDKRGNRYYLDNRDLSWHSFDGKKRLKFGRR